VSLSGPETSWRGANWPHSPYPPQIGDAPQIFWQRDLVKYTVFVTRPDVTAIYREMRDRMLEGHAPPATYVVVAGLASPELLVEIEGEAVAQ